ncbi:MAG: hypothetical protein ABSB11_11960 [Sedimentisphaerales bacterium]|jgi:hypothetical protein
MANLLSTFQSRITHLQPSLLLTLAVVTIATGLFVLLGGLGLKKVVFVVTGLFFGAFCTLFSSDTNLFLAAAVIGTFALIAFNLQDMFLVLIASAAAAVIGYLVLIRPYFLPSSNILAVIRQFTISVPYYNWPLLVALTVLPFVIASWQDASALFTSAAGAILVMAGTVMALLNSGYPAVGYITTKQDISVAVLALATIAGAIIQLWLLPEINVRFAAIRKTAKTKVEKVKAGKGKDAEKPKTATWRTA